MNRKEFPYKIPQRRTKSEDWSQIFENLKPKEDCVKQFTWRKVGEDLNLRLAPNKELATNKIRPE